MAPMVISAVDVSSLAERDLVDLFAEQLAVGGQVAEADDADSSQIVAVNLLVIMKELERRRPMIFAGRAEFV